MSKAKSKVVKRAKSKAIKITKQLCTNALCIIDRGLSNGLSDNGGKVCIEYAISIASGTPEDREGPKCVDKDLRSFKIDLNDELDWDNEDDRAQGLRRIGIAQLGTDKMKNFWGRFKKEVIKFQIAFAEKYQPTLDRKELDRLIDQKDWDSAIALLTKLDDEQLYLEPDFVNVGFLINLISEVAASGNEVRDAYIEGIVQVLKKLKTPGSKYLYLTEGKRKLKPTKQVQGLIKKLDANDAALIYNWHDEDEND